MRILAVIPPSVLLLPRPLAVQTTHLIATLRYVETQSRQNQPSSRTEFPLQLASKMFSLRTSLPRARLSTRSSQSLSPVHSAVPTAHFRLLSSLDRYQVTTPSLRPFRPPPRTHSHRLFSTIILQSVSSLPLPFSRRLRLFCVH